MHSSQKYHAYPAVDLPNRQWPNKAITKAPIWCSVDLRDGNQALIEPMNAERKHRLFKLLIEMGFKEIEVGFPAASQTDFDFIRELIEKNLIPDDVTIQVLTQAREPLIKRSFEALEGIQKAIVHVYNSTSEVQRRLVFKQDKEGVKQIALSGAQWVKDYAQKYPQTQWTFQYSPESFVGTELDYAVDICDSVCDIWQPTTEHKAIINLPATVEMSTPNIHADQIEWFLNNTRYKEQIILSVHPHNDRGCGVASAELTQMAGAQRVEGTLFGNGERTGNVDIITLALNLHTQGIEPGLVIDDIYSIMQTAEYCTQLPIHPRHPYAGELVFTAFSGSHQDAIKKGFEAQKQDNEKHWEVPYLPIDPADVGRSYEAIIRVNSQSGKGGIAYLLEKDYGLRLPRRLQIEFSQIIQQITDEEGCEVNADDIWQSFKNNYLDQHLPIQFEDYQTHPENKNLRALEASILLNGSAMTIKGEGNGPIDAYVHALKKAFNLDFRFIDYQEHASGKGEDASAVSYVEIQVGRGDTLFGVASHQSIVEASLRAVTSAVNRAIVLKMMEIQ